MEASARDLEIYGAPAPVRTAYCDLLQPDSFAPALDQAARELGGFDTVVVTAGLYATQEELENDPRLTARLLAADFTNTVLFCEEARRRLLAAGGGTLCAFSSVAGERGRKPVVLYGAAKAGLSRYLEGLDHKFRGRGLKTVCVKPGFVKTGMTAGLKPPPFAGTPDDVARARAQGDRPRLAGGVRSIDVALGDVRDPPAAALGDAADSVLRASDKVTALPRSQAAGGRAAPAGMNQSSF